jgi:hypothetical protein
MQLDVLSFNSPDECSLCTILNVVVEEEIRSYCYSKKFNILHWSLKLISYLLFPSTMTSITASIIDPAAITLVEQKHSKLLEAIENVEKNREKALSSQKEELEKIHADEIKRLKLDIITLQEKIASDERVCTLEKERDFYRKESMKLNATVETLKSKLDKS